MDPAPGPSQNSEDVTSGGCAPHSPPGIGITIRSPLPPRPARAQIRPLMPAAFSASVREVITDDVPLATP